MAEIENAGAPFIHPQAVVETPHIGAGSVVTSDIPDHALAYGSPARVNGYVCRCAADLVFDGSMARWACGQTYALEAGGMVRPV